MEKNYIRKNIRFYYFKKLLSPIVFLILLAFLWLHFSFEEFLFPYQYSPDSNPETLAMQDISYVESSVGKLYYTGYTCYRLHRTVGYFYYTQAEDGLYLFYLLSPSTCENGTGSLTNLTVHGKLVAGGYDYQILLTAMADKIGWTYTGISEASGAYYISEPDYNYIGSMAVLVIAILTGLYAVLCIFTYLLYVLFPTLTPPCRRLARYGSGRKLILQAEEELATLPQLATEDMFITEHFFIEVSSYGIAVIPISEIVWIYKHSTLHRFTPRHLNITYTLHIYGKERLNFDCPRSTRSNIDGIIDYLAEANHDILVGFSEENLEKAKRLRAL